MSDTEKAVTHIPNWVAKFPRRIQKAFNEFPSIRSDRQIMSGAPCVAGRRVPVWVLASRYAAGETLTFIADDYEITKREVVTAIRFALWVGNVGGIRFWKFYRDIAEEVENV